MRPDFPNLGRTADCSLLGTRRKHGFNIELKSRRVRRRSAAHRCHLNASRATAQNIALFVKTTHLIPFFSKLFPVCGGNGTEPANKAAPNFRPEGTGQKGCWGWLKSVEAILKNGFFGCWLGIAWISLLNAGVLLGQPLLPPEQRTSQLPDDSFCRVTGEALQAMAPSTRRMASLLEKLALEADPRKNTFLNTQIAQMLKVQLGQAQDPVDAINLRGQMALALLNAGDNRTALGEFEALLKSPEIGTSRSGRAFRSNIEHLRAVAYLRIGEFENCLTNHNIASCILPIQGEGVHRSQEGSRAAIDILSKLLQQNPADLRNRWLLNVAAMTVGDYPDKVPPHLLIPPSAFASDYDIKRFPDIAGNLGLDLNDLAGGSVAEDFDGDGYIDLMTSDWSMRGPMHFFHNNGDGTFTERTEAAGIAGLVGGLHMVQGDYNNDGLPDVLVLRGAWLFDGGNQPDSLLRNDGGGHFTDVTEQAGLLAFHPGQAAVWFDYNNDGWLDVFFGYESYGNRQHPCQLFRNNRDGTFTDVAPQMGLNLIKFVKGVVATDINNDGRPDLYLSIRDAENILLRNDGPIDPASGSQGAWKFTEIGKQAGVTEPIASFPTIVFDYDNDGWEDLFVSGYSLRDVGDIAADYLNLPTKADRLRLFHNNRDGTYADVTQGMHLFHVVPTMGCSVGDFDNDGWLDLYLGTGDPSLATLSPNRAFRNDRGTNFQDVTTSGGFGHLQKGHSVCFADFNNDGAQDIYHSVGGAYETDVYRNVLYENPGHGNRWVCLKLEGVASNRVGIGARVRVMVQTPDGERTLHRTVANCSSFGANPLRLEIGLGHATHIKRVEVFWPVTGRTQTLTGFNLDRFYRIREGDPSPTLWPLKTFAYSKIPPTPHAHVPAAAATAKP